MPLSQLLVRLSIVTGALIILGSAVFIGQARLGRFWRAWRGRMWEALPYLAMLGAVLLINNVVRIPAQELSWLFGINITPAIFRLEGTFVAWIQDFANPLLTTFLGFMYIYGYVFLLVFPLLAYLVLDDQRPFREACLAYTYNYAFGLILYIIFIAFGPRNMLPDLIEPLLYDNAPEMLLLTSEINENTNVFPSLHTSLSVTVALLAYRTRDVYPYWMAIAMGITTCIVVSTMYLGHHWLIDVIAGTILAIGCVKLAARFDVVRYLRTKTNGSIQRRLDALIRRVRRS